jgi:hypothetical protein
MAGSPFGVTERKDGYLPAPLSRSPTYSQSASRLPFRGHPLKTVLVETAPLSRSPDTQANLEAESSPVDHDGHRVNGAGDEEDEPAGEGVWPTTTDRTQICHRGGLDLSDHENEVLLLR